MVSDQKIGLTILIKCRQPSYLDNCNHMTELPCNEEKGIQHDLIVVLSGFLRIQLIHCQV